MEAQQNEQSVMRLTQVQALSGMSETLIYTEMANGRFPRPIRIGRRVVGWLASEVHAWLAERVADRDNTRFAHADEKTTAVRPLNADTPTDLDTSGHGMVRGGRLGEGETGSDCSVVVSEGLLISPPLVDAALHGIEGEAAQ